MTLKDRLIKIIQSDEQKEKRMRKMSRDKCPMGCHEINMHIGFPKGESETDRLF